MWQQNSEGLYKEFLFENFKSGMQFLNETLESLNEFGSLIKSEHYENKIKIVLINVNSRLSKEELNIICNHIDSIYKNRNKLSNINRKKINEAKLYADGGSRGNPGPSASGYVIFDMAGNVIIENGVYIGLTTNNQAEYHALKLALEDCIKLEIPKVHVFMDSLLVINQMIGKFKVKNRDLWPVYTSIKETANKFKSITFTHVPREYNKVADSLVNQALDNELKS